ncbi:transcription factor bHLH93-like [Benincasa hispida]|uniref:transcription factor bHLH93-like n=1 Tax=Benincasa hispida TaxID=102211 RepID=UPI001902050F|nr:transcription factor bHLH93-like [Benincasa hispida]
MEMNEQYLLLEEVLGLRREMNWELAMSTEMNELISNNANGWNFDCSDSLPMDQHNLNYLLNGQDHYCLPTAAGSSGDSMSYSTLETPPSSFEVYNGEYPITSMEEEELGILEDEIHNLEVQANSFCKAESIVESPEKILPIFNTLPTCDDFPQQKIVNYSCTKKLQGQPSKNLMAERRRRKRLNDRLSMLRSIVPKISKMDRTAILADAIEYVKELMEKIKNLEREIGVGNNNNNNNPNKLGILRDVKPNNEYLVRNSPKFNVERREDDTRIEICCAAKPGLLLSTVNTLETLGLDIQQCVISCFNDFAIQASCSEGTEHRTMVNTEEVKQALFENAGYGGKCL